jgi:hypothetical protein
MSIAGQPTLGKCWLNVLAVHTNHAFGRMSSTGRIRQSEGCGGVYLVSKR